MRLDAFGCVWMRLGASGCSLMRSENLGILNLRALLMHVPFSAAPKSIYRSRFVSRFFANFCSVFDVFVSFSKFSDLFGPVWMRLDAFGCIWMRLGSSGCVLMRSENFGIFQKKLQKNYVFLFFVRFCEGNFIVNSFKF